MVQEDDEGRLDERHATRSDTADGRPAAAVSTPGADDAPDAAEFGTGASVAPDARVGLQYAADAGPAVVGRDATIRSGSVVYGDTEIGDDLNTGHRVLIRESTTLGDDVLVGTDTVIEDHCVIGSHVRLQTGVYLPSYTTVGDRVFVGPRATMTNDPYPLRQSADLRGPTLADDATVGANATLLPGVRIGERAFVAAGAVVTEDVPDDTLAVGAPASHRPLPDELTGGNELP